MLRTVYTEYAGRSTSIITVWHVNNGVLSFVRSAYITYGIKTKWSPGYILRSIYIYISVRSIKAPVQGCIELPGTKIAVP